jgi:hypothetical protein
VIPRNVEMMLALAALVLAAPGRAQDLNATVTRVERKVELMRTDAGWEPVTVGMSLLPGDRLHTGFHATCAVKFPDGSTLDVKPMSMVLLQKLEEADGKQRARVWLKLGEVSAEVAHARGSAADFQVKTPTTTASVRGTSIHRISYNPAFGTIIEMGSHGLLEAASHGGRVAVGATEHTQVHDVSDQPLSNEDLARRRVGIELAPAGTTDAEQEDVLDTGVPKSNPVNEAGSGLAGRTILTTIQSVQPPPVPPVPTTRVIVPIPLLP